ncbi:DUF2523 domain-containing protein [Nitrosomonas ureae]|uniref:Uncharacterized protein DUF2523 n=1 Tax=Nitrosomonas ureae TaxID=44577 RepID=A0A1H9GRN7_9PROT|nr:DUF2523 domain-containing protein [Nitrosomonas ureae]PTQ79700.1 uncharacterized protein DUF2523 [Nitrosomonas ureae]SEQ52703.1 Protein of unknown function [Nitrosomonas ureae]SEQ52904.1 Protein of unknown function [Nitrosomonas ureae]SOD22571.1 Protein of unknown function [Nitrosomonas ureae]
MFNLLVIPLGAFLTSSIGYLAVRALMGLGIGVISYGAISIALELLYTQAQGYYNNVPAFALQVVNLAGFGQGLGIIMGAITFRMTFVLLPKLGVIPK